MDNFQHDKLTRQGIGEQRINDKNSAGLDLSHRDFSGMDLRGFTIAKTNFEGSDFTGADLRCTTFSSANCVSARFIGADLRGANLAFGYFHNADFRGADLRGTLLADAICNNSYFCGADLRGALLGVGHYDSDFRGADLRGCDIPIEANLETMNCDTRGALLCEDKSKRETNKRATKRIQILPRLKVFDLATSEQAGYLMDITTQGFRISSGHPFTVGCTFNFRTLLPQQDDTLACEAICMWSRQEGETNLYYSGFKIHNPTQEIIAIVDRIIAAYGKTDQKHEMSD